MGARGHMGAVARGAAFTTAPCMQGAAAAGKAAPAAVPARRGSSCVECQRSKCRPNRDAPAAAGATSSTAVSRCPKLWSRHASRAIEAPRCAPLVLKGLHSLGRPCGPSGRVSHADTRSGTRSTEDTVVHGACHPAPEVPAGCLTRGTSVSLYKGRCSWLLEERRILLYLHARSGCLLWPPSRRPCRGLSLYQFWAVDGRATRPPSHIARGRAVQSRPLLLRQKNPVAGC